jgi:hypothetical protein
MMGKKKTGAYMGGGMAKKKGSMYNKGGMPMVMKAGKKVPAFAADGVGKMNMGGMAKKKKKPMAATGYKEGGDVKKKETFGQAFKRNRKKFMNSGSAADYTFKHNGKSYNILQKGETKAGVMKKFSAPKTSVRPKTRPSAGISANTKKKIEETVKKVANTDSKARPSRPSTEKTETQKRNDAAKRKAIRRSSAASKTLGTDPAPRKESGPMSARAVQRKAATQKARLGPVIRGDGPPSKRAGDSAKAKAANSAKVRAGQAKFRDRTGPQSRARNVTYAEWKGMSRAKRKMLGLPVSVAGGELGFKRFRKGLTGKEYTMRTNK